MMIGRNPHRRMKRISFLLVLCSAFGEASAFLVKPARIRCSSNSLCSRRGISSSLSMASYIDNEDGTSVLSPTDKRTLYDVLGANPSDTREELKKRYTSLAKICHPDALLIQELDGKNVSNVPDFTEIAAAWRVLSDKKQRKRYDRSLRAEEFSDNILNWMGDMAKQAAPVVESFGSAAHSMFMKTTASTVAGVRAAATEVNRDRLREQSAEAGASMDVPTSEQSASKMESKSTTTKQGQQKDSLSSNTMTSIPNDRNTFSEALKSAAVAARMAQKGIESMELLEQSQKLESRAIEDYNQAAQARQQLQDLVERRLSTSLHTPGSGLTSSEAFIILEDFNKTITDDLGLLERAMMKHTVEYEINALQKEEEAFLTAQKADTMAQESYQACIQARLKAKQALNEAEKKQEEARRLYEAAQAEAAEAKKSLGNTVRELAQSESQVKKSDWEIEIRSVSLERQSEKVRQALKQKEKQVRKERGLEESTIADIGGSKRLQELNDLRNEERLLAESSSRLERMANRLQSRAEELRMRAEELEESD